MIVNTKVSCDADMQICRYACTNLPDNDNDIQVNHLNPVDEAMIADASCRLVAGELTFIHFLLVKCFLHIIYIN